MLDPTWRRSVLVVQVQIACGQETLDSGELMRGSNQVESITLSFPARLISDKCGML